MQTNIIRISQSIKQNGAVMFLHSKHHQARARIDAGASTLMKRKKKDHMMMRQPRTSVVDANQLSVPSKNA